MNEYGAIDDFLTQMGTQPSALLLGGEAGIGKTTLWLGCIDRARHAGYRVLTARAGQLETALAYATVGDLLADVEEHHLAQIPDPQRLALRRVLMLGGDEGLESNPRLVATAFRSLIEGLARNAPTLVAVDDVQWLDSSSRSVLAHTARRLRGRVGVLVTERREREHATAMSWLRCGATGDVTEVRVSPLSAEALHVVIEGRFGRSFPRPTMSRIATISGGNPLYALELARAVDTNSGGVQDVLPRTLAELLHIRIGRLSATAVDLLVAAACVPSPTVDLLVQVTGETVAQVMKRIEEPEDAGIVALEGNRLTFTHPVLAQGVYLTASSARRRHWHRAWANVVTEPESRARHLAMSATNNDQATLAALDEAAEVVRAHGAPAAAAELLDLAIGLGGDTPMRRFAAAEHHLRSGDAARAQAVLKPGIDEMPAGPLRALMKFGYAVIVIHTEGYTPGAQILCDAIPDAAGAPEVAVVVQMMLAFTLINDGVYDSAREHAEQALTAAEGTSDTALISQALAVWCFVAFNCGLGHDESQLQRSLRLEDRDGDIPIPFQARASEALIMAWTGRLEQSATALTELRNQLVHRGGEIELLFISYNSALVAVWLGRYTEAQRFAEETFQRVEEIGGAAMRAIGQAVRGWVHVHTGRPHEARADLTAVIAAAEPARSSPWWYELAVTGLARLEIAAGRYEEALEVLAPLLDVVDQAPSTEIVRMEYLPDAIEAMIATGRSQLAEPLIERLNRNGHQLDRAWMLAVGGRCHALWLAANGDVGAALEAAERAMAEHRRLPMPLECARTQLVLGQLHRRRRQRLAAAEALSSALHTFEHLESTEWVARTQAEIAKTNGVRGPRLDLTLTERRVVELAANGLSNSAIAAAAHISVKTVEANLTRIYRKLGVRSRVELARRVGQLTMDETADGSSGEASEE